LGVFPIIYYHFDQNRCLGLGLRIVRLSEKNKLIFLMGMPLFAGGLGIFAKNAKKGILSNYPQKGCFFVRFCPILSDFVTFCNFWGFGVAFLSDFVGFELKAKKALKRAFKHGLGLLCGICWIFKDVRLKRSKTGLFFVFRLIFDCRRIIPCFFNH
jgi:hypothetical protein